jgi:hypothetical protein
MLLRAALNGRAMTWALDLREKPVSSGYDLLAQFVAASGYNLPPRELLGRAIFAGRESGSQVRGV